MMYCLRLILCMLCFCTFVLCADAAPLVFEDTPADAEKEIKPEKEKPKRTVRYKKPKRKKNAVYPYSREDVDMELEAILSRPAQKGFTQDDADAINRLNAYRFLAGVEYDVKLDRAQTAEAQDAAEACKAAGQLSHHLGHGTDKCNLGMDPRFKNKALQVDMYMDDPGANNREVRGHRLNALRPNLDVTGFGWTGQWAAMRCFGTKRGEDGKNPYAYPGMGYVPLEYVRGNGWSYCTAKMDEFKGTPTVRMWKLTEAPRKAFGKRQDPRGEEVKIKATFRHKQQVIFEPDINFKTPAIYWVQIKEGRYSDGYLVHLYDPKAVESDEKEPTKTPEKKEVD